MSYRTAEERELFRGFIEWLTARLGLELTATERQELAEEYQQAREQSRAWPGAAQQ